MNFLNLEKKSFLLFGVANKKSIAWYVGELLKKNGASVYYSVRSEKRKKELSGRLNENDIFVCDVENKEEINRLAKEVGDRAEKPLAGILHSIAFANYSKGIRPFHQTERNDFLQATSISAFSLVEIANAFKQVLDKRASVVTVGISSQVTTASYGYMAPIKAALESSVRFLAKSFSQDTEIRFNSVNPGPLKTSASAGIPGFLKNYLFAEKLTLRKKALLTAEVANVIAFLLSEVSSGVNGQSIVVNAGMDFNYFDEEIINKVI